MTAGGAIEADGIELSWEPAPELLPRAMLGFWRDIVPPPNFVAQVIRWAVVWFLVGGVALLLSAFGQPPAFALAGVAGAAVVMLGFAVLSRVRMRRFHEALGAHWQEAGRTKAWFDATGVRVMDGVGETRLDWRGVDGIAAIRGGTLLRAGISLVVVPDGALPDGLAPAEFRARLEGWRA